MKGLHWAQHILKMRPQSDCRPGLAQVEYSRAREIPSEAREGFSIHETARQRGYTINQPPSTTTVCPTMKLEAWEARNTATPA